MMWDFLPTDAFTDMTWSNAVPDTYTPVETTCEFECHACGHTTTGYQMGELMVHHGWRLHSTGRGQPFFVMCGDCEKRHERNRSAR